MMSWRAVGTVLLHRRASERSADMVCGCWPGGRAPALFAADSRSYRTHHNHSTQSTPSTRCNQWLQRQTLVYSSLNTTAMNHNCIWNCIRSSIDVETRFMFFYYFYSPCGFGVRIVLLYSPACRKRRLKGGGRGSLMVKFAAARCQGPRFYPGQGRNLDRDFCSMRPFVPPLGPQHRVPEPVPSLETHLKSE